MSTRENIRLIARAPCLVETILMSVLNYIFLRISLSAWYLVDVIGTVKSLSAGVFC